MRVLNASLLALALPSLGLGYTLAGSVADPQQRLIVGARVTLSCEQSEESVGTDSQGRFRFSERFSFEHCMLLVSHPGFEIFKRALSAEPAPVNVRLCLVVRKEAVQVVSGDFVGQDLREAAGSSLGSASLSDIDLRGISNNTADFIKYAKAAAGADTGSDAVYTDGLPSSALPPAEMVGRIDVNADPFSAEYSDNSQTHINITTKSPDRRFRFNFGGAGVGFGGGNSLAPGLQSVSHSESLGLTGPIPHVPLAFSLHANFGSYLNEQPIEALTPPSLVSGTTRTANLAGQNGSGLLNLHYSRGESSQIDFAYAEWDSTGSNIGVGGLTLPEAGSDSQLRTSEARLTFTRSGTAYLYRGGLVVDEKSFNMKANTTSLGITVPGSFVAGGASLASNQSLRTNWTWKNVIQFGSKVRLWTTGVTLTRSGDADHEWPNPTGSIEFSTLQAYAAALTGQPTGTWFFSKGNGQAHYATLEASPFMQGDLLHSENLLVTGGMRVDYQTRGGILLSPRLSAAGRKRGFVLRAGAGMFVHDWPSSIFLRTIEDDGLHLQNFILEGASFANILGPIAPAAVSASSVTSRLAPKLVRPRDWMLKGSAEHAIGKFTPGLEYTWVDGLHLLGSQRLPDQEGWMDLLESNRARQREQLHARLRYTWRRQNIVAHYEWIQSHDNTDGPFSFPENEDNLAAEWARTAGVSPRNFTIVDTVRAPGGISLSLVDLARGSAPYNITSGLITSEGLFNDRAGRARNSGNGPRYDSLSLYGSRRISLPSITGKERGRIYLNVGVRADNLLGNRNYLAVDSVLDSPLFGRPLAAGPGRSVRLWCNLE
jgi:hypothetical protein